MDISKATYVPGWMDRAQYNGMENGVDIWTKPIDHSIKINSEYVIAHSLGANFALENWKNNQQAKLVLINPLLPNRNFWNWLTRWIGFFFTEGVFNASPKRVFMFRHFYRGILNAFSVLQYDPETLINEIPRDRIVVITGKNDRFFMDAKAREYLQLKGVKVFNAEKMGHVFRIDCVKEIFEKL